MTAIKVPPLGESIVEATVSRWLKKEGDAVSPGDTLVELETDKITVEVPAMSSGVLTKRAHAEGDVVKVDELLAEIEEGSGKREEGRGASSDEGRGAGGTTTQTAPAGEPRKAEASAKAEAPAKTQAPAPQPVTAPPAPARGDVRASPAAQRVAAEQGVDLSE